MWMAVTSFDMESLRFSRIPSYLIFDEQTRLKGPITRVGHGANRRLSMESGQLRGNKPRVDCERGHPAELAEKLGIKAG